jgi:hypothetical protein
MTFVDGEADALFEALWTLVPSRRGALSAAAKVKHARVHRAYVELDADESAAVAEASGKPKVGWRVERA